MDKICAWRPSLYHPQAMQGRELWLLINKVSLREMERHLTALELIVLTKLQITWHHITILAAKQYMLYYLVYYTIIILLIFIMDGYTDY